MKAQKTPSGKWRVQAYDGNERKSFTHESKREVMHMAMAWKLEHKRGEVLTIDSAIKEYISSRENILSPNTIRDYKRYHASYYAELLPLPISAIDNKTLQIWLNEISADKKPKTVANIYGFLASVINVYAPEVHLNVRLPQKQKPDINIPSTEQIQKLLSVSDDEMYLMILFAVFCTMRRSEIAALTMDDIDLENRTVTINKSLARNENLEWVVKAPKTPAGNRVNDINDEIADRLRNRQGKVTDLDPNMITRKFLKLTKKAGLPQFRFHDLRHYSCSMMFTLGFPVADVMRQGGWEKPDVPMNIYNHCMQESQRLCRQKWQAFTYDFFKTTHNPPTKPTKQA